MTDRELLELAAKAAGIEWYGFFGDNVNDCQFLDIGEIDVVKWNPLTDDGDALRLAVKLEFDVWIDGDAVEIFCGRDAGGNRLVFELVGTGCPYSATRRAIVRAASSIGKTK